MSMILLKAHNKGYVKKDGTVVKPFDDKRHPKQHSFFSGYLKHIHVHQVISPHLCRELC
jgi:hypothetical protein